MIVGAHKPRQICKGSPLGPLPTLSSVQSTVTDSVYFPLTINPRTHDKMPGKPSGSFLTQGAFALYRLSPLHSAGSTSLLSDNALQIHARRLTDTLKGDALRGVTIGLGDASDGATPNGPLKDCKWSRLTENAVSPGAEESASQENTGLYGIRVDIQYENNAFIALFLGSDKGTENMTTGVVRLPLLMTRMPTALRERFLSYLAITFDTRVEPMRVSGELMGHMLDDYLEIDLESGLEQFEHTVKAVQLGLGFSQPVAPSLRSVSIDIRREDVLGFIDKGKAALEKAPSNGIGPFMTAMRQYLLEQTTMDIAHDDVTLTRVSCGGFTISSDGKLKLACINASDTTEDGLDDWQRSQTHATPLLKALLASAEARIGHKTTGTV
jgi:hypothetical protein